MTTIPQQTDGMVVHHVAEFMYYPHDRLQKFYVQDQIGYIDSIYKMIQLLTTSEKIALPGIVKKEEADRLKEELSKVVKLDESSSTLTGPEYSSAVRSEALAWVKTNWDAINSDIEADVLLFKAILGHVRREFTQCFLLPEEDRLNMTHYLSSGESLEICAGIRNEMLYAARSVSGYKSAKMTGEDLGDWLKRNITTHYVHYGEYAILSPCHYTPAITRSHLTVQPLKEEPTFKLITRCIAIDILKKVKNRTDIVNCAMDWIETSEGKKVIEGFHNLELEYVYALKSEKKKIKEDIEQILGAPAGRGLQLTLGLASAGSEIARGKVPVMNGVFKDPKHLRWLYSIRNTDAYHELFDLVKGLVDK